MVAGAGGHGAGPEHEPVPRWQPSFELLESKLHPPWPARGMVPRTALVQRLLEAPTARLIRVVAPPGYGKTTLLAQWAQGKGGPVAWVSVDRRDNDPVVLLSYLAVALDRVQRIDPSATRALASPGAVAADSLVPRFVAGLSSLRGPVTIVLDNLELVVNRDCLDAVAEVALRLPAGSQLALVSRARATLPEALLRPRGQVLEVGPAELAMDEREARALLEQAGVRPSDAEVAELRGRTEGWPVGLYLASFAVHAQGRPAPAGPALTGNGRVTGAPRPALLSRLAAPTLEFLTRTSVLDQLSGPLCDAVLEADGSDRVLESLAGSNLLIAVDRERRWYRYHQLLRELLQAELERRGPELVAGLHGRAAAWYEANGQPELAVEHGQAAGDVERVARLVTTLVFPAYARGQVETARRWLRWFEDQDLVGRYPRVAVLGAQMEALLGNPSSAERWTAAAEAGLEEAAPPDGAAAASVALLRTLLCRDGMARMRADATTAQAGLAAGDPWRATALLMEGISYLLDGQADQADPILARVVEVAGRLGATPAASAALGERAVIALDRRQWDEADRLAGQAVTAVAAGQLDDYAMAAFVHAVAGRAALQGGDPARARAHLARTARLRPLLTAAMPHRAAQTLLELARTYLALDDVAGASSLTAAELRLLPLLSTHLTLLEIGERLYLSRNTVKTQAISIYRKLGVSSRSEAMERVQEQGLLDA